MSRGTHLTLATRGSALARWQATMVKERLESRRMTVELVEVETTGDEIRDELIHQLGTTGAFVRSLDERVLSGELDGSVHSMKDMPTEQPEELVVAGIPERSSPNDVLLTPDGTAFEELPEGATIGTASLRRGAQLQATRPDITIAGLRGNVDTRVEKLLAPTLQREHEQRLVAAGEFEAENGGENTDGEEGENTDNEGGENADETVDEDRFDRTPQEWFDELTELERQALGREVEMEYDAICLAEAGLKRSGLLSQLETERFEPRSFVPAPAQGAIAVTALDGDIATQIYDVLDHPPTRVEVTVERTVLSELGGGCVAPVGIYARLQGEVVTTSARILSRDGTEELFETREIPVERHAEAAVAFATDLAEQGATDLIEQAKREQPDGPKRE